MRKVLRQKVLAVSIAAAMVAGLAGYVSPSVQAAGARINRTKANVYVGYKVKLSVKNATKKVKWSSSKKKVATVTSKGVVKGKSKGKAVICAKTGSKRLYCKVTVKNKAAAPTPTVTPANTITPVNPTLVPTQAATKTPATPVTTATTAPTSEATQEPVATEVPAYMAEGAFVYENLDISWIDPEKPMVAFTFDDGPVGIKDTDTSMRILATLKKYNCHATFNYITSRINDTSKNEILQAMEQGCEIGNHTTAYDSLSDTSKYKTGDDIAGEVEKARQKLEEITGISNFTLRPPNLGLSDDVYHNVNVPMIGCNVYSNDWNGASKDEIIANVENAKDGDIVLMHETYQTTADAVEVLVPYFLEKGYQIVSASELYAAKNIPIYKENYYNCTTKNPDKPKN